MRKRSHGRVLAMQFLFSLDASQQFDLDGFDRFAAEQGVKDEAREFALRLVNGVAEKRTGLVSTIEDSTRNWSWKRMPLVDRNLLLIGTWEILHAPDIPSNVTINELVELAKQYGGASSGAFVNGVLDTIRKTGDERN